MAAGSESECECGRGPARGCGGVYVCMYEGPLEDGMGVEMLRRWLSLVSCKGMLGWGMTL